MRSKQRLNKQCADRLVELRNQVYRDVFNDGKVANLKLLQTWRQINSEASAIGFLNTTFDVSIGTDKIFTRASLFSNERKLNIKSVSREIEHSDSFGVLKAMNHHSILSVKVKLLTNDMTRQWLARPEYSCTLGLSLMLSEVARYNPNVRKIVMQYRLRDDDEWSDLNFGPDRQLQKAHEQLKKWVGRNLAMHKPSLKEKSRDKVGITAVEMSFRIPDEAKARVFTVQWDVVV